MGKQPMDTCQQPSVKSNFVQMTARQAKILGLKLLRPVLSGGVIGASEFVEFAEEQQWLRQLSRATPEVQAKYLVAIWR